ncbi:hypothetical protein QBC38DRAFT_526714, partial [Podospora fimiseda]
ELKCFDKPLDAVILTWYQNIGPQIERLLVVYLKSGHRLLPQKYKPIAVRLMLLGKYEAEAQPHLVVFAPSKGYKKVESFFAKEDINDLLTIWSTGLASIPIIVTSHPDTGFLTASHCISDVPALCSSDYRQEQLNTFCGVPICIGSRQLTFGGIIRVLGYEDENGSVVDKMLFGISAGHLVDGDDEQEEEDGDIDESSDDLNDDTRPTIVSLSALSSPPPLLAETQKWRWSGETSLGRVLEFHDIDPAKPGLDWSLIKMNNLLPNIIDAKPGDGLQKGHLITPRTQSAIGSPSRSVVVMSGAQGIQRGTLHFVPTRVILGRSEAFSDAYILKLSGGFIGQGDLGSWVVDTTTYEVFGHVVAKDALGDGIVIPMWDILRDIKSHLRGSDVVELP